MTEVKKTQIFIRAVLFGLMALGAVFLIVGGLSYKKYQNSESVDAKIISYTHKTEFDENDVEKDMYAPVYSYVKNGETFYIDSNVYSSRTPTIGKSTVIHLNNGDFVSPVTYIVFSCLGVGFIFIPLIVLIILWKERVL